MLDSQHTRHMWRWWRKQTNPATAPPVQRRQKTYSAQSGYVYQYVSVGLLPPTRDGEAYGFDVTADRKSTFRVVIVLPPLETLLPKERYAVAKLALFDAFDEATQPAMLSVPIQVSPEHLPVYLATLGLRDE